MAFRLSLDNFGPGEVRTRLLRLPRSGLPAGKLEAELTHSAAEQGRNPDELLRDAVLNGVGPQYQLFGTAKAGTEGNATRS